MKKIIMIFALTCFVINSGCATSGGTNNAKFNNDAEIFYHIFPRSFYDSNGDNQGDFQGIIAKLDYLQTLGVTTLWLNPIYLSEMYHNYFGDDFMKVDMEFGTIDDFRELCMAVHRRGMKILIDMETVYIPENHLWFKDSYHNPTSRFSTYVKYNGPDNTEPESIIWNMTEMQCFDGNKIKVMTLNLKNKDVLEAQKKIYTFWIDPNQDGNFSDGVDGYRMDHIMDDLDDKEIFTELLSTFWKPIIRHVRSVKPDCFFLAEQAKWDSLGTDIVESAMMDATFNIPLRFTFVENLDALNKKKLAEQILTSNATLPRGKFIVNIIENHDIARFATICDGIHNKMILGATFLMTMRGIPCIYYGQEIGMKGEKIESAMNDGADIPMRDAMEWFRNNRQIGTALWYKGVGSWQRYSEAKNNDGISVEEESDKKNSLLSYYRKMALIRKKSDALNKGDISIIENDNDNVFTYARTYKSKDTAAVLLNFSNKNQTAHVDMNTLISGNKNVSAFDLIAERNAECSIDPSGKIYTFTLKPYESKIIRLH